MARKQQSHARDEQATTDTQGCEPSPAPSAGALDALYTLDALDVLGEMGVPDQAYKLHLRNIGYREIGRRLGIDKDTAQRYVKQAEREMAPRRREAREKLLRAAIARLRGIVVEASDALDQAAATDARGASALLNTRLGCEREIARLQGLYEALLSDEDGGGITITISRRAPPGGSLSASGEGSEANDGDQ